MENEIARHRIRQAISEVGVSFKTVANLINIEPSLCEKILTTRTPFRVDQFLAFFIVYQINLDYIYGMSNEVFDRGLANLPRYAKIEDLRILLICFVKKRLLAKYLDEKYPIS